MSKKLDGVRVRYRGEDYKLVLGPPCFVEQRNGPLMGTGMPTVNLADPSTGELCIGLTVDIPEAPLRSGQVLVGGKEEGVRALTVVRHTREFYRSPKFDATFAVCDLLIDEAVPRPTTLQHLREAAKGIRQAKLALVQKNHEIEMER